MVELASDDFLRLIHAAKITAYYKPDEDPILSSALITSVDAGAAGDELVATTSDGICHGQMTVPADGRFDKPILLELATSKWLTSMVTTANKKMRKIAEQGEEMTVSLSVVTSPAGDALRVQTLTGGVQGEHDAEGLVGLQNADDYNADEIYADLVGVVHDDIQGENGSPLPQGKMTPWSPVALQVMSRISRAMGEPVLAYPLGHVANRKVLICGDWRGSVPGTLYQAPGPESPMDVNEPFIDVVDVRGKDVAPKPGDEPDKESASGDKKDGKQPPKTDTSSQQDETNAAADNDPDEPTENGEEDSTPTGPGEEEGEGNTDNASDSEASTPAQDEAADSEADQEEPEPDTDDEGEPGSDN